MALRRTVRRFDVGTPDFGPCPASKRYERRITAQGRPPYGLASPPVGISSIDSTRPPSLRDGANGQPHHSPTHLPFTFSSLPESGDPLEDDTRSRCCRHSVLADWRFHFHWVSARDVAVLAARPRRFGQSKLPWLVGTLPLFTPRQTTTVTWRHPSCPTHSPSSANTSAYKVLDQDRAPGVLQLAATYLPSQSQHRRNNRSCSTRST